VSFCCPSNTPLSRFLILQLKRIGDAVLTAPTLGALREAFPGAHLTLILAGAAGQLRPLLRWVDEVRTWQDGKLNLPLLHHVGELAPDVVLDCTGTDRSAFLALLSRAPVRVGYEKFASGLLRKNSFTHLSGAQVRNLHTIDFHHALPAAAGLMLPAVADAGHLVLPAGLMLPPLPERYVLIHPGSARQEKFWPPQEWGALLDDLYQRHRLPLVLTGGDWDFEQAQIAAILSHTSAPILNLRGALSLEQLAGVIAGARLAVTVDTAAVHLAAAFRVPQIALFGPTNPFHWTPRHAQAIVIQSGIAPGTPFQKKQPGASMAGLSWQTVAPAVDELLGAR
jgi:ADP-heptose:LPS heptosyltransferase